MGIPLWQDIYNRQEELDCKDWVQEHAPEHVLANLTKAANDPDLLGADGIYYRDTRAPWFITDGGTITLSTTHLTLWSTAAYSLLPANYWTPGKTVHMSMLGKATTDGTSGNWQFGVAASNAANTNIVSSTAAAVVVSRTNDAFIFDGYAQCRTIGTGGTFRMWGLCVPTIALFLSTVQPLIVPATLPADVTVDTTAAGGVSLQANRSGAGVHTAATTSLLIEALN